MKSNNIMIQNNQIEIPLSKKKMFLTLMGSVVFIIIGVWFIWSPPQTNHWLFGNQTFLFIAGVSSILFFGLVGIVITKKIFDTNAGLIIKDEGILDNASGVSAGLVLWADIKEIKVVKVMSQKFLMIIVKNPQEYIGRQSNVLKKKGMQMNYDYYGSPVSISSNALKIDFDSLHELLQQRFSEQNVAS